MGQTMEHYSFSKKLGQLLSQTAREHGHSYPAGGADAWGLTGASYLGFALCGLSQSELRNIQYRTRDTYGPVILDCRWYDKLIKDCFADDETISVILPGQDCKPCSATLTTSLFAEMLDFCREG